MTADVRDRLRKLTEAREKATAGAWKLWGMSVMADQDGTSNVDTAVRVAHTCYRDERGMPRTFDATFIADAHRNLPWLVDVGAVAVDVLDVWAMQPGDEKLAALRDVMERLRAVVAAAGDQP